jgi:hypothetical protein
MRVTTSLIIAGTERKEGVYVTVIAGITIPVIAKTNISAIAEAQCDDTIKASMNF